MAETPDTFPLTELEAWHKFLDTSSRVQPCSPGQLPLSVRFGLKAVAASSSACVPLLSNEHTLAPRKLPATEKKTQGTGIVRDK